MKAHRNIDQTGRRIVDPMSGAFAAVINGTEWLTAQSVGTGYDPQATDPLSSSV